MANHNGEHEHDALARALLAVFRVEGAVVIVADYADIVRRGIPTRLDMSLHCGHQGEPQELEVVPHRKIPLKPRRNSHKKA